MTQWQRTAIGTSNNIRLAVRVVFDQVTDGPYNITKLTVGLAYIQRKVWFVWIKAKTADRITLTGEFGGPRSPRDVSGNSGYKYSNPFQTNYSSEVVHFIDYSPVGDPMYTIDHATYKLTAYFKGVGTSATLQW